MITDQLELEQEAVNRSHQLERMQCIHHKACPVCGGMDVLGVNVVFTVCDDAVQAPVMFKKKHEGYVGYVHGGVIATVLDAAMTNCMFSRGIAAVTGEMTFRVLRPVSSQKLWRVRAWLKKEFKPLYILSAELDESGRVVARAKGKFVNKKYRRKIC